MKFGYFCTRRPLERASKGPGPDLIKFGYFVQGRPLQRAWKGLGPDLSKFSNFCAQERKRQEEKGKERKGERKRGLVELMRYLQDKISPAAGLD